MICAFRGPTSWFESSSLTFHPLPIIWHGLTLLDSIMCSLIPKRGHSAPSRASGCWQFRSTLVRLGCYLRSSGASQNWRLYMFRYNRILISVSPLHQARVQSVTCTDPVPVLCNLQSEIDNDLHLGATPNAKLGPMFWEEAGPLQCIHECLTRMVFREFQGKSSEVNFVKFILEHAQVLKAVEIFLTLGALSNLEAATDLMNMASLPRASKCCKLVIRGSTFPDEGSPWCHLRARDLSIEDPFDITKCLSGNCLNK